MRNLVSSALATAGALLTAAALAGGAATTVIQYDPGTGYATDWATGAGFTNAPAVLGEPSRQTVDPDPQFGGTYAVDPFSPPYLASQITSIGAGGSLTVQLSEPAVRDPNHLYGIDLLVFGSSGFLIVNGDYTGGGVTDGTLFGAQTGQTRVEVSADGQTFYTLSPSLAPVFDNYLPTDGAGDLYRPADPALGEADFANKNLAQIRALYAGSAGGTGYSLAWARDAQGNPVALAQASFVRLDVLSGHAEIDAVVAVPEPATWALLALGAASLALTGRRPKTS